MTEEDYEVDEGGHKKIHKVGRPDWFYFCWSDFVVLGYTAPYVFSVLLFCMKFCCVKVEFILKIFINMVAFNLMWFSLCTEIYFYYKTNSLHI
jgi:hypothetical protein